MRTVEYFVKYRDKHGFSLVAGPLRHRKEAEMFARIMNDNDLGSDFILVTHEPFGD